MNSIFDVLISMVIGALVLMAAFRMDSSLKTETLQTTYEASTIEKINTIYDMIEFDFRKIGHGLINPWGAITHADSSRIIFSYDKDPSTVYDSVRIEYRLVDTYKTSNPHDKILRRIVNGQNNTDITLGVTEFNLWYTNKYNTQLARPVVADSLSKIRTIELELVMQSTESVDGEYSEKRFRTFFTPKNLLPQ